MNALWGFIGVITGGIIAAGGSYFAQKWMMELQNSHRERALAKSIAAEIEAYLAFVRRRDYVQLVEHVAEQLEAGTDQSFPRLLWPDDTPLGQFPVFEAVLPRVGELGSLAGDVAEFYTVVSGVRSTLIAGARGAFDDMPASDKAVLLKSELVVWRDAERIGAAVIPKRQNFGASA